MTVSESYKKMAAKGKPKCIKGTACGYSCISGKYTCSDKILKRDADALLAAVGAGAQRSRRGPDPRLAKLGKTESQDLFTMARSEFRDAQMSKSTNDPDYVQDTKDWARQLRPGFTNASIDRLSQALRFKGLNDYDYRNVGPAFAFKVNDENFSDKGHDVWPNLNKAAVNSLIENKSSFATRDVLTAMSEAAGVSADTAEKVARAFAKHISDGFVTREATLDIALGGETAKALDEFYAKAPKFKGKIYRGMTGIDPALLEDWQKNGMQQDLLTSWTSTESVTKEALAQKPGKFAVVVEAENKTGISARAFAVDAYKYQDEVIGKPNTNYDVVSVEDRTDSRGNPYKHVTVREQ